MATLLKVRQKEIDGIIEDVQFKTGFSYPEDSLLKLAEGLGVRVVEGDLSTVGQDVSGIIEYEDDNEKRNPRIYINTNMSKSRKMFTLAHELGHHLLHKGRKFRIDDLDYSSPDEDILDETEANYFAASLLVPASLLVRQIESKNNVQEIADYFGVSVPVIKNRIKWLQLN